LKFAITAQYLLFFIMYTTILPPQADDLLSYLFQNTVGLRRYLDQWYLDPYLKNNPRTAQELQEQVRPKYQREKLHFFFILNFTIPAIIQLGFIIYYFSLKLARRVHLRFNKSKSIKELKNTTLKRKIDSLEYEVFVLVGIGFIIEMTCYCMINLTSLLSLATTKLFQTSTYLAALYFIGLIVFFVIFWVVTNRTVEHLQSRSWMRKWGILYRKYDLNKHIGRRIRIIFFFSCFLYAILLIVCIASGILQSILTLLNICLYTAALVILNPYLKKGQFFRELVQTGILILLHLLMLVFCIDDSYDIINSGLRNVFGWLFVFVYLVNIYMRIISLAIQLIWNIRNWLMCSKTKQSQSEHVPKTTEAAENLTTQPPSSKSKVQKSPPPSAAPADIQPEEILITDGEPTHLLKHSVSINEKRRNPLEGDFKAGGWFAPKREIRMIDSNPAREMQRYSPSPPPQTRSPPVAYNQSPAVLSPPPIGIPPSRTAVTIQPPQSTAPAPYNPQPISSPRPVSTPNPVFTPSPAPKLSKQQQLDALLQRQANQIR